MPQSVLFIDVACPTPYTGHTLVTKGMGGTEATVVRVAEGLAKRGYPVSVQQKGRSLDESCNGVEYISGTPAKSDVVILLRNAVYAETFGSHFRDSKKFLWLHDLVTQTTLLPHASALSRYGYILVPVSDYHKLQTVDVLRQGRGEPQLVRRIYNPIDDALKPDDTAIDRNKLVFLSSPHKGLTRTLEVFGYLRNFEDLKGMHLTVLNPGYYESSRALQQGVYVLGSLPHAAVVEHVRSSFAVFHLNTVFPETFGIVSAEACAVGTPTLTHDLGAGREILPKECFVDARSNKAVIDTLLKWKKYGRPTVSLKDCFKLYSVLNEWENVINGSL